MSPYESRIDPAGEFPVDVPEYFFYLMFIASRHRDLSFDGALGPVGLTLNRWRTLSVIRRLPHCTMKDLARYSTIDRTTLTRSVDHMVKQGVVERSTPPGDRRKVELVLTDKGEALYFEAVEALARFNRLALRGIDVDAQRQIVRSLKTLVSNLVPDPKLRAELIAFSRLETASEA